MRAAVLLASALLAGCQAEPPAWSLAIHGGARNFQPGDYTEEQLAGVRGELAEALHAGAQVLEEGGSSLDAVQATVVAMENSPWFNAGRGAVFTHAGTHELDASIMDGATGAAGAVASVSRIRNPIALARLVMERTPHVLLVGQGAEAFAAEQGVLFEAPEYFHTERRWQELQKALEKEKAGQRSGRDSSFGTVGAVARDRQGRLAAATSTGGMTNKRVGRVGDSPLIGAGTFADARCAVSATGHGEYFIRNAVAHDICVRTRERRLSVGRSARIVIHRVLKPIGGEGGVVTMDDQGVASFEFSTNAMSRGSIAAGADAAVAVLAAEELAPPPGHKAPDFSTQAALSGKAFGFSLKDALKKGPVVVYFYPSAYTGGCNIQAHEFAVNKEKFDAAGATIVGVSHDGIARLIDFSANPDYCAGKFAVASDPDGKIARSYDLKISPASPGSKDTRGAAIDHALTARTTFVIATDSTIVARFSSADDGITPAEHVARALAAVSAMRHAKPK
ncbi:MAG: isoaspartyl peptidase/L-asparaginase [Nevskiaceae bacterium]